MLSLQNAPPAAVGWLFVNSLIVELDQLAVLADTLASDVPPGRHLVCHQLGRLDRPVHAGHHRLLPVVAVGEEPARQQQHHQATGQKY